MSNVARFTCLLSFVLAAQFVRAAPAAESITLDTLTGTLHGTLLLPPGDAPVPVVLMIAGSGPTDRDGNVAALPGRNDSLKMLAEGLATNGIASLRYDKRGIAASAAAGPQEKDLRFDMYVADAAAWVARLKKDPRFSRVVIAGHSEGSLIGMLAAANADGFVSIAGASTTAGALLREQLRTKLPAPLLEQNERILATLEAGRTVDEVPAPLLAIYRPSVQPYMISWLRHDPAKAIGNLAVPVLIVQGTSDVQISVEDARRLHRANPKGELAIIEGMNHVLKRVTGDLAAQLPSYSDPSLPVSPELIERVSAFANASRERMKKR
jgi:alpha-beta hydrolase superfamily lysophospholipase